MNQTDIIRAKGGGEGRLESLNLESFHASLHSPPTTADSLTSKAKTDTGSEIFKAIFKAIPKATLLLMPLH